MRVWCPVCVTSCAVYQVLKSNPHRVVAKKVVLNKLWMTRQLAELPNGKVRSKCLKR